MLKKAFQSVCSFGSVAEAWVSESSSCLTLRRSWVDYSETVAASTGKAGGYHGRSSQSLRHYNLETLCSFPGSAMNPMYDGRVKSLCPSPSNTKVAMLIKEPETNGGEIRIEIWGEHGKLSSAIVDKVHGNFVLDRWFGGLSWDPTEQFVSYVAESKPLKSDKKKDDEEKEDITLDNSPYAFKEDWGEVYTGVCNPTVVIYSLEHEQARVMWKSEDTSMGQPTWMPSTDGTKKLAFTSWNEKPVRLGMIYCYQRPSQIGVVDLNQFCDDFENEDVSVQVKYLPKPEDRTMAMRSPRFSSSGVLAFLAVPKCDTHGVVSQLCKAEGDFSATQVVVNIPKGAKLGEFPGLFLDQLPQSCWRGNTVWFSTLWNANVVVLGVDMNSGQFLRDHSKTKDVAHSDVVLATSARGVLVYRSTPGDAGFIAWHDADQVEDSVTLGEPRLTLSDGSNSDALETTIFSHSVPNAYDGTPGHCDFQSILLTPKSFSKEAWAKEGTKSLVVQPHGGPHAAYTTMYIPQLQFMVQQLNTPLLLVNFRGSTGLPAESLSWLPGRAGQSDVADVAQAATEVLDFLGCPTHENMVSMVGGSHGGFLTAHMSAQHPELVRCAVLRNPVVNIPTMSGVTDIPDWATVEAVGEGVYNFESLDPVDSSSLEKMLLASPINKVRNVGAPSLLHVGMKDRRVPPSQAVEWHRTLKARGVTTEMLMFPDDTHAIDKPLSNQSMYVTTVEWIQRHGVLKTSN